jgi:cytochrome c oxidase subunit I+III
MNIEEREETAVSPHTIPLDQPTPVAVPTETEADEQMQATWADPQPGPIGSLKAIQNDAVGGRIMITAFIFFLVAGVLALLMRWQLIRPENSFVDPQTYNGLFTMHGSTMMYLFAVPMLEGLAIILLPLMLGNREMPFPRLGVFSYFTFVLGGLLFFSAYLLNTVPDAGWFAYTPLSGPEYSPGIALDYWLLALGVAEVSAIAAGVEIIIAILRMRAPGMSLSQMPLYAWAMLVTAFSILFAFTPLIVGSLLLELDRKIGTQFFNPAFGGSPILWRHLFWIFGHPEVYIQFLPATGALAMIVPVFSRQRIIGYNFIVLAMVSTGFISFALWVHHMFAVGIPQVALGIFSAASIFIAIPTGVQIFAYLATILSGRPVWKTPFYFVIGFLVTFVLGGITGVMVGAVPFDWQAHDKRLGVITNGGTDRQRAKLASLGLLSTFDVVLISEAEGVRKPSAEIFRRALRRCQVQADESVFVGDHPETDIEGARNAGLLPIWKHVSYWPLVTDDVPTVRRLVDILPICLRPS